MMKNIIVIIALVISLAANAQMGEKNYIDQNYIEVTGKAEMEISPDLIYLEIKIDEKDSKNKKPIAELETKMVNKFKELGINVEEDLLIKDLSSNFKDYFLKTNQIVLQKDYQLIIRDGKMAGLVFSELEKIGISNVSILKLDHSKIKEYRNEVKVEAIKAAKEKAKMLAGAIGQKIGAAIYINELNNRFETRSRSNRVMMQSNYNEDKHKVAAIDFEKIKLEYSILCKFKLNNNLGIVNK